MKIIENVYMLDSAMGSHVFLLKAEDNMLIDTGLPGLSGRILTELRSLGALPESIKAILLTHHDVDHTSNAKSLQVITQAKLWAPEEDVPYILGEKNRPGFKRVLSSIVRLQKPVIDGRYTPDQHFGELKAIHAPGHTPGHTIFQYRNVLFTGDLFQIINGKLQLLPGFMNWDVKEVKKSIALLKSLEFEWLCPSHGRPVQNSPAAREFISRFI
jgi:glyoxylase-like metal-dependent hydrolase (beta-lactamase superfamily II)